MDRKRLGSSDLELTKIGLGTWAIGGPWDFGWGPQSDADSIETIHEALDLGINWIDTAPAYGLGHSERIVGKAIRDRRSEVLIATKCGLVWDDPAERAVYGRLRADSVKREAEASLRRLRIDVIDLYQIHWPNPEPEVEEAWEAISDLVDQGKVRCGGISNFSVSQLERVGALHPVTSLQPPYNLFDRSIESEILRYCRDRGVGVIAYGPMAYGLLTGKYDRASLSDLPKDDWRRKGGRFREPELGANLAFIERLQTLARELHRPISHIAIAWVLRRPEVTAAIVGARRPGQIAQTAGAGGWRLPDDALRSIDGWLDERDRALDRTSPD